MGADKRREAHDEPDYVEVVYRWKVNAPKEFFDWIHEVAAGRVLVVVARISQPVLGPSSDVWELRLQFHNLLSVGLLLDSADKGDFLWDLADIPVLWLKGRRSPIAELIETHAPIYRTWVVKRPPRPAGPPRSTTP